MTKPNFRPLNALAAATAAVALAVGLLTAATAPAAALGERPFSMEILVDGVPLDELHARGATYVEALAGHEYAVRLTNNSATRVAVALSVDGLNSIDATATPVRDAARWIVDPWSSVTIDGWQTGADTARRFFFTTEERSYGAWLGETSNLGIVSAAFFREKPKPIVRKRAQRRPMSPSGRDDASMGKSRREPAAADRAEAESLDEGMAATGIGREVDHRVRRVTFRGERDPSTVLSLRYEYRDELVRLGVLPTRRDALERRERARGFADAGFAPDPYRRR